MQLPGGLSGSLNRNMEVTVDDERPDWDFWCFVIALIGFAFDVMTQR